MFVVVENFLFILLDSNVKFIASNEILRKYIVRIACLQSMRRVEIDLTSFKFSKKSLAKLDCDSVTRVGMQVNRIGASSAKG